MSSFRSCTDKKRPTLLLLSTTRLSFCDLCSVDDRYNGKRGRRQWVASTCFFRSPTAPMSITRQRQLRNRMTFNIKILRSLSGKAEVEPETFANYKSHRLLIFKAPFCHSLANKLLLTDANACANEVSAVAPAAAAAAAAAAGCAAINCDERTWKRNGQPRMLLLMLMCSRKENRREE
ncbi:hypothetical protein T4A_12988 [Trichinella pseudospiralis]|uniref:Uncharacterized protein n=1 Tax=Trichinella pseudospiralis TaxID=6337 RepID=A0A0V1E4I2_TRIPS|nr:hypothetical protein T4A_12988 [Trichinella pseudospiralis]